MEAISNMEAVRVAMEAGAHTICVSEQLQHLGHEVIVANVQELRAISHSDRKSDKVDAEKLVRYARLDPQICAFCCIFTECSAAHSPESTAEH